MAPQHQEFQVVLTKACSYSDGRYKFKKGVPVTMSKEKAEHYRKNYYFAVRTLPQARKMLELEKEHKTTKQAEPRILSEQDALVDKSQAPEQDAKLAADEGLVEKEPIEVGEPDLAKDEADEKAEKPVEKAEAKPAEKPAVKAEPKLPGKPPLSAKPKL